MVQGVAGLWHRHWPSLAAISVAGYALAWSWSVPLQALGNVVFWLCSCLVGFALLWRSRRSRIARKWLLVAAASVGVLALTALWSIAVVDTLKQAVQFGATLVIAAAVGAELESDGLARDRLVRALAWLAPGALAITAAFVAIGLVLPSLVAGAGTSGPFNGPNVLSIFLALTLPFTLLHPRVAGRRLALLALLAATAFAGSLSGGRTGLGALMLAVYALAVGRRRVDVLAIGLAACALAVGVTSASSWTPRGLGEPVVVTREQMDLVVAKYVVVANGEPMPNPSALNQAVGGRTEAWAEAVRLLDERPAQGHGFGTGWTIFDRYESHERFTFFVGAFASGTNPHNAYLQAPLELGIAGGFVFLVPILGSLLLAITFLVRGTADASTVAFSATVVAAAAAASFESTLTQFGPLTLLSWIAISAVAALWMRRTRYPARRD